MTVQELIDALSELNPDAEIEILVQPNYPLRSTLAGVTTNIDVQNIDDEDGERVNDGNAVEGDETVVYLLEGSQLGYGATAAWAADRK